MNSLSRIKIYIFIFFIGSLLGCFPQQKLTNTYRKIKEPDTKIDNGLKIVSLDYSSSPYSRETKKTNPKTLFDLKEKAQKELIKSYAAFDTTSMQFRNSLIAPLEKQSSKEEKVFNYRFNKIERKINFLVEDELRNTNSPNNRIESLKIEIQLEENTVEFLEFIDFQTKLLYYDIGNIEASSSRNFSISSDGKKTISDTQNVYSGENLTSALIKTNEFSPSISYSTDNLLKENVSLRKRYISQAGFISKDKCVIYMEGTPEFNLNGIVNIGVTLVFADSKLVDYEYTSFKLTKNDTLLERKILLAPSAFDIKGDIKLSFLYRNIERKGKSPIEGKHLISYYNFKDILVKDDTIIVPKEDIKTSLFNLKKGDENVYFKHVQNSNLHQLTFLTAEEAFNFREFIQKQDSSSFNDYTLVDKDAIPLTIDDVKNLGLRSEELKKEKTAGSPRQ